MKKITLIFMLLMFSIQPIQAKKEEKIKVTLASCTDGDTAHFYMNQKNVKVRFLGINAPEYTKKIEPYGKEASEYVCNALNNAHTIEIEYDNHANKTDAYDRHLVWVFVDGVLLNEAVVKEGLAEVTYLYDNYKYTDQLLRSQQFAKDNELNIWSKETKKTNISIKDIVLIVIGGCVILFITFSNNKNKMIKLKKVKK